MGIFSSLVGCKSIQGPDQSRTINKILHIKDVASLEYELPTNMSKLFNFDARYENESSRTIQIDPQQKHEYATFAWLSGINADGAMWEYKGSFWFSGLGGELGSLHLDIYVSKYEGDLKSYISARYDEYLNGPKGRNTKIKKNLEPGRDEEEINRLLLKKPSDIQTEEINGLEFYRWNIDKELSGGKLSFYYVLPFKDNTMLSFRFYRNISVRNEKELIEQEQRVTSDIAAIMNSVKILDK